MAVGVLSLSLGKTQAGYFYYPPGYFWYRVRVLLLLPLTWPGYCIPRPFGG